MRVTYVIPGLGTGGAEHSLAELLAHGFDGQVEADVVCLHKRDEGVQGRVTQGLGVPVTWLSAGSTFAQGRELRAKFAADPPDLVVTSVYEADIVGRLACLGKKRPRLLTTLVNSQYDPVRVAADPNVSRLGLLATQIIDGVTGRLATDHYIALTQAVADHAHDRLKIGRSRITVVPRGRGRERLGFPSPERKATMRAQLGIADDRLVLLTVGRREYQKGQIHLLNAMPRIVADHPDVVLLVAGREGNASDDLTRAVDSLGLGDAVRFLGHEGDVPGLLAAADVFVFPSLWEGFGGALIEALAMGLPVVVSALPELKEVLGTFDPPTGITVPAADPPALADAVVRLLADADARAALGAAGRKRFDSSYELNTVADQTLAVYRSVVGA